MQTYQLTEENLTGIQQIDNQHQLIVDLMNELDAHLANGQADPEVVARTLRLLVSYTGTHFREEEKLMAQHNYPDLEAHRAYHEKLLKRISSLEYMAKNDMPNTGHEILHLLREWLYSHIMGTDMKYVPYVEDGSNNRRFSR